MARSCLVRNPDRGAPDVRTLAPSLVLLHLAASKLWHHSPGRAPPLYTAPPSRLQNSGTTPGRLQNSGTTPGTTPAAFTTLAPPPAHPPHFLGRQDGPIGRHSRSHRVTIVFSKGFLRGFLSVGEPTGPHQVGPDHVCAARLTGYWGPDLGFLGELGGRPE
jgi:hypothetical protein